VSPEITTAPPLVFYTVTDGRLNGLSVINRKCNHLDAILVVDNVVLLELFDSCCDALGRQFFVLQPDFDVERVGFFKSHQRLGADRANKPEWLRPAPWLGGLRRSDGDICPGLIYSRAKPGK